MTKEPGFGKIIALALLFWAIVARIKKGFGCTRTIMLALLLLMGACSMAYLFWFAK